MVKNHTIILVKKSLIVELIAHLFIILFLYTGISKLMDIMVFQEQLIESSLLEPVGPIIAWMLPIIEFAISGFLFVPRLRLKGLFATLILMLLFTGYVLYIIFIEKGKPCSCGGIIEILSWQGHLIFNIALIGLAITSIIIANKNNN